MSPRYLMIVGDGCRTVAGRLGELGGKGLSPRYSNGKVAVLTNSACPCIALGEQGCILGTVLTRDGEGGRLSTLAAIGADRILKTRGKALLEDYWGAYVAALGSGEPIRVRRDPSGTLPCYYSNIGALTILASDAELLAEAGVAIKVDLEEVARQLYRAFVPAPETALGGVRELLAGFAIMLPAKPPEQEAWWSPWDHVTADGLPSADLAEQLRDTVLGCIRRLAMSRGRLLLSVSGGLDSSIIAACLKGTETVCLTMFADDPSGDERPYARALCHQLGLPLVERAYRLEDIDIGEPLAPHLPRPRDRTQAVAYERVHLAVASELGADAFVTGNGGDNVFGYSQSAAPIADRYLEEGISRGLLSALADVCRQTGCSIVDALRHAARLAHEDRSYKVRPNALFLDPVVAASFGDRIRHPWLAAPDGALPGKAAHISAVLRVQPNIEASRGYYLPVLTPLLSQPIVELCLSIPSWAWRRGGRDRSLARQAFASDLPAMILNRRVKGTPSRFAAKLLDHFRGAIRERLLGGRLAGSRLIDSIAVERALKGDRPVPDLERVRLLELVNAEAWIGHWTGRQMAARGELPIS